MNEIYKVQVFMCVTLMSWMMSNCTPHFVAHATSYKQYIQCYSDHKRIILLKCIWSYLSQFLIVLDEPRPEFKVIGRVIRWNSSRDRITGLNQFKLVFCGYQCFSNLKD